MTWYATLPRRLPKGRLVTPDNGTAPRYWLSTWPAGRQDWSRWRARHHRTGLWPVLVMDGDDADDPFHVDEEFDVISELESFTAARVLEEMWQEILPVDVSPRTVEDLGPIGRTWPGLAPAGVPLGSVESFGDEYAGVLLEDEPRLALIPAPDGAHALTALGWLGPTNHENDTGRIAAVVADWQSRFGVQVVGLGFDTLHLSVAAPPATAEHALLVAAEHAAFCPDNIWQSSISTLPEYAQAILDVTAWGFWWD